MAEQELDRNEAATPHKLHKAREQGQTGRSTEAVAALVFVAAMTFIAWHGLESALALVEWCGSALQRVRALPAQALWPLVAEAAKAAAAVMLPLLLTVVMAAVAGCVLQTGMLLSATPLHLDFARVNPATGLKRLFSLRTLFDGARACVKVVALAAVAWWALRDLLAQYPQTMALTPAAFLRTLVQDAVVVGLKMAVALVLLAVVDVIYCRAEFHRRMRMSRRELKDEFKNREGDPRIRVRLRELRREMLKRSLALKNTRSADVVLTNPTHYAVALRYVHGEMDAPRVVAKGAGQLAAAMRAMAARHEIVVVQNPPLTRRLFRATAIDDTIPADFHAEVARIIVWVFAARRQRAAAMGGTS
jgi:flagellar biosynthetic protein FlhB